MRKLFFLSNLVALLLIFGSCRDKTKAKSFEQLADNLKAHFVSDSRVDRFEVRHRSGFQGLYLEGYTTIPEAYDSLQATLADGFVVAKNNVRLLPDAATIGRKTAGIINVSVANLRSKPGHSQELATQALMGTPVQVLDFQDGWYMVRTPDRYIAWLEPGAFVRMTKAEAVEWLDADLVCYLAPSGDIIDTLGSVDFVRVSDLVAGNLLKRTGRVADQNIQVELPDGTTGWVFTENVTAANDRSHGVIGRIIASERLLIRAEDFQGRPYLWGGTSPKGMDCSGFTKTTYYLNGYVIPRDASQQVHAGAEVELTDDFSNLKPGDLLFFGGFRNDGSEKITHVGFYTGNGRFLHAGADNGRIMEQSLLPGDENFAEHRLESLMRARRLSPGTPGVVPVAEAFRRVLE